MNEFIEKDPFLHKLLKKSAMEEPSADFTISIMQKINANKMQYSFAIEESFLSRNILYLSLTVALLSLISLYFIFPQYFTFVSTQNVLNLLKPYFEIINMISIFLKSNLIIAIIALSALGLLFFDKILFRIFHSNVSQNQHVW